MLPLTDLAASMLTGSYVLSCRATSWLNGQPLAAVPVATAVEETDRTLNVPERLTLTVPRVVDGVVWDPAGDNAHPLAPFGQRLTVEVGIGAAGRREWLDRGEFLIDSTTVDGDTVTVVAVGLLQLIAEARFVSPYQPSGNIGAVLRRLVEPALTVDLTAAPTDRAVPSGLAWDEDRLGAVYELLGAWPADVMVRDGVLVVTADDDPAPEESVLDLTDGTGGTVLRWSGSASRDGCYTRVVARGEAADGGTVQGEYADTGSSSPLRDLGTFNPLSVPYLHYSPLLTTVAQCQAAARTTMHRLRRNTGRVLTAMAVPHPGLQAGDRVTVTGAGLIAQGCVVEGLTLPLTAGGGAMQVSLREVI